MRGLGLRCAMVVPLTARGRTFGALTLIGAETHPRYGPADLQLAEEIADRAALAIDTARAFADESEARAAAVELAHRNEVLKDVTAAFGRAASVPEVLTAMLELGFRSGRPRRGPPSASWMSGGRVEVAGLERLRARRRAVLAHLRAHRPAADVGRDPRPAPGRPVDDRRARPALPGAAGPGGAARPRARLPSAAARRCRDRRLLRLLPTGHRLRRTTICRSCARSANNARRRSTGRESRERATQSTVAVRRARDRLAHARADARLRRDRAGSGPAGRSVPRGARDAVRARARRPRPVAHADSPCPARTSRAGRARRSRPRARGAGATEEASPVSVPRRGDRVPAHDRRHHVGCARGRRACRSIRTTKTTSASPGR